jgi:hypothetical protein
VSEVAISCEVRRKTHLYIGEEVPEVQQSLDFDSDRVCRMRMRENAE